MTDAPLARFQGAGPLRWSVLARLVRVLTAELGFEVSAELYARTFPAGPAEGFHGGAVDWQEPFDPADPEALALGEDLLSVEFQVRGLGAELVLGFLGERTAAGPRWSLEVELEAGAPEPSSWEAFLLRVPDVLAGEPAPGDA